MCIEVFIKHNLEGAATIFNNINISYSVCLNPSRLGFTMTSTPSGAITSIEQMELGLPTFVSLLLNIFLLFPSLQITDNERQLRLKPLFIFMTTLQLTFLCVMLNISDLVYPSLQRWMIQSSDLMSYISPGFNSLCGFTCPTPMSKTLADWFSSSIGLPMWLVDSAVVMIVGLMLQGSNSGEPSEREQQFH